MPFTLAQCQKQLTLFILVASTLALTACGGGGGSGGSTNGAEPRASAQGSAALTYFSHAKALIDSRCVTCHNEGGQAPFSLSTYEEVAAKQSAIVYALESGSMPVQGFAPLTDAERSLLLQWLEEGADRGESLQTFSANTPYTYYGHAKAILEAKCANCHSPGEIAPFSLTDYQSVYAVRAAVAHQIDSGAMPPWPPTDGYLRLQNSRALSDEEKAILTGWIAAGAPEGVASDYQPAPVPTESIEFDLTLKINEPYTPTTRPDEYRCLMIDWPLDRTVYVDAVNVVPDVKAQVHHVFAVIVDPEDLHVFEAADGADGRPGFPCLGAPSPESALIPPRTLTVWAPGITAGTLPEGTGVRIDPGSKIAMQMHYNTINTNPQPDQSSIEVRYAESVEREAITVFFLDVNWYPSGGMPIPADDPNVTHQFTGDLAWPISFSGGGSIGLSADEPVAMHSVFMHQHVLGKSASIELLRADGTEVMLVDIRDWDFDWQDEYVFDKEVIVEPGDRLRLTCTWDNSAANQQFIDGEQITPQYVEFGEGTLDEMCVNYFYVTKVKAGGENQHTDFAPTVAFKQPKYLQAFQPGDYVPIELLFNAFKLREPNTGHTGHGQLAIAQDSAAHTHHEGHYHVYLDTDDDAADHLTRWDNSTFYQLPDDIATGEHTLRVSLRNDNHEAIGVEKEITFVVDTGAPDDATTPLIDAASWQMQTAAADSLPDHRPASVDCPDNAWYEEDNAIEVETGYCNYLSLTQPSKAEIVVGDNIHLVLWHGQLRFDEPAEAHVAISAGGQLLWESYIEVPNKGGVYDITVPSTVSVPAGEPIEYHLHNHGYNTWTLLTLEVEAR